MKTKVNQESIRQWPINLCTSSMMLQKITPSVDCKLVVETFGHSTKLSDQLKFDKSSQGC